MGRQKPVSAIKRIIRLCAAAVCLALLLVLAGNLAVCLSAKGRMRSVNDSLDEKGYDCVIVMGCGVWGDRPTTLLSDRLDAAIALYKAGVAPKLLMSGDHGRRNYDEVNVMRRYAMDRGVPSEDIFMDHAGFSTYETMYRAKDIFGVSKAVVVTQEYHLYRALYDASAFDIEAVGTIAAGHTFGGQTRWEIREALARVKDLFWCMFKPEPTYRGEKIDIKGSGEVTAG
ncbi:MAG: YdcF family protein [Clostridia bacterium]|nr:YdcF family protein [Clostridia bacterium]